MFLCLSVDVLASFMGFDGYWLRVFVGCLGEGVRGLSHYVC